MKNFWRRMAAREGFTLVELVVVIAILAILAAVAYPAYTGYIKKADDAAVVTQLDTINTAVRAVAAGKSATVDKIDIVGKTGGAIESVTITTTPADAIKDDTDDIIFLITGTSSTDWSTVGNILGTGSYAKGATMENNKWSPK